MAYHMFCYLIYVNDIYRKISYKILNVADDMNIASKVLTTEIPGSQL